MKEKLQTALGSVGMFLFYVLIYTVVIAPLWYIGAPWWAYIIAAVIMVVCHQIMGLLYVPPLHLVRVPCVSGSIHNRNCHMDSGRHIRFIRNTPIHIFSVYLQGIIKPTTPFAMEPISNHRQPLWRVSWTHRILLNSMFLKPCKS